MSPWSYIVGAYAITIIAAVLEILAVRARHRAARGVLATPRDGSRGAQ